MQSNTFPRRRSSKKLNTAVRPVERALFEGLEDRRMFALLGVGPLLQFPELNSAAPGYVSYTAGSGATGAFDVASTLFAIQTSPTTSQILTGEPAQGQQLHLNVNKTTGAFDSGIAGFDLVVQGNITIGSNAYSGTLLQGEVLDWGWSNSGASFDFRIAVLGGTLTADPSYAGKDVGIRLTREDLVGVPTPARLPGGFFADFGGNPKAILGPINPLRSPSAISGYVYEDDNNDGTFQTGTEAPIPGTVINLTGTNDFNLPVSLTTTTDANGFYSFPNLRPGTYQIAETQPGTYLDGKDTIGTPGGTTSNDLFTNIVLPASTTGTDNNFGELKPAKISGYVFYDANNDGSRAGDAPIQNTLITLTGTDDLNQPVSVTTTTDSNGYYFFEQLRPGNYALAETQPAGYLDGKDTVGTQGGTLNNDAFTAITLVAGTNGVENNFGEILPSSIAGFTYYDSNNDGLRAGETAISGVSISLTGADDLGPVSLTATTDGAGFYQFTNLRPGTYVITETQPVAYLDGKDTVGTPGGTTTNDQFSAINLPGNYNGVENNFGELLPSSIAGVVYIDSNNDGLHAGDTGISGVTVTLTGSDDLGPVSLTTTTDSDGKYKFENLRPGVYTLTETQPVAYLDGKDTIGTPGGTTTNDKFSAITLNAGVNGVENNFGELIPSSISGYVYYDSDNDGLRAGETGINTVSVTLTGTDDLGPVSITTATDGFGFYSFPNLRPGTYVITETQPVTYLDGKDTIGTPGGTTANDQFSAISLAAGVNGVENNFGELLPAQISGYVYYDANNDGLRAGDAPISGVTVTLTGSNDLGAVSLTTTTDGAGFYSFGNLRPGSYQLTETQPVTYLDGKDTIGTPGGTTSNDQFSAISLPAGFSGVENNFGELLPAQISGYVYADANNDGLRTGDAPISGVTVTLTGSNDQGPVSLTTTTNASGLYSFVNLRPGTYVITESQPVAYLDGKDTIGTPGGTTANDQFSAVVLTAGTTGVENNFGELLPASISGYTYYDANNDGLRAGDAPISGVTVTLTGSNDLGAVSLTTTTNASGFYSFGNLRPGSYQLNETQPVAYLDGKDTIGTPGGTTSNDQFSAISLPAGFNGIENNFGELLPASIAGVVYVDANNDGLRTGDTGISGVTVTLTGSDDLGPVSLTTTTNGTGAYSFTALRPGTYVVTETQPSAYLDGKDTVGTPGGTTTNDKFSAISLAAGVNGIENNFGELLPASIAGVVYVDANNDGLRTGDTGISGVTVTLTGSDDLGPVSLTTTTNGTGAYSFTALRPGTYVVTETQPSAYLDGKDTVGTPGGTTTNDKFSAISLAAGVNGIENNFGELLPASIAGVVYVDANNDGLRTGDTGISGVTVTLTGSNDQGPVSLTTTTNGTGAYSFTALRPGTYVVTETQPSAYLDGKDTVGTPGGTTTNDKFSAISLNAGVNGVENNFGELLPASIAGVVYVDANNDGLRTGDTGISGVTVTLTGSNDQGPVSLTTTTNGTGAYSFTALRPGTYVVTETQPSAYLDGKDTVGTPGGTTTNDKFSAITLNAGVNGIENNFGELLPASVAGVVYVDANNDGSRSGDTGISGVTVTLTGSDDQGPVSLTTTTNGTGAYSFTALRPGTYVVTETQPSAYLDGKDTVGTPGGTTTNDKFSAISLNAGVNGIENNFGELLPAQISGYVYVDSNNDGLRAGESPISGVTITLTGTNDQGAVSLTTTTNASGFYSFGNLRPGTYQVAETQPAGYNDGKDTVGSQGGTLNNDLFTNVVLSSGTNGIENNFGERTPAGSIGGTKFLDITGNGFSSDDTGLGGVTINLYADKNNSGLLDAGDGAAVASAITATTGSVGTYSFGNLAAGTYFVQEVVPTGYLRTGPALTDTYTVTLAAGQTATGKDFDNFKQTPCACTLSNVYYVIDGTTVVTDLRGNVDQGDVVTAHFTYNGTTAQQFTLVSYKAPTPYFDANNASQQTIFDIDSRLIQPGQTVDLTVEIPNGYFQVDFVCGFAIDKLGPAGSNIFYTPQGRLISADNDGTNAPLTNPASLAGNVYNDVNNDGIKQSGEAGIGGVLVTLTRTDAGGTLVLTRFTDPTGAYQFSDLPAGTYKLSETQPSAYTDGKDTLGTVNGTTKGTLANDLFSNVAITAGQSGVNYNYGEGLAPSSIAGFVWVDFNNDGQIDFNETAIANVKVTLTGTNDLGQAVSLTDYTDGQGYYNFAGLRPGSYTLTETQPAGYTDGKDSLGSLGGTLGNDVFSNVQIAAGVNGINYNFGERPTSGGTLSAGETATIGFWHNNNGQCLIKSFNGSANATNLGNWLAATFPNLYGANAGSNNLAGKSNTYIASFFLTKFNVTGQKLEAQVLAVALAVYATNSSLAGGTMASGYGFNVGGFGTGDELFNVGSSGAAFGVANNTNLTIMDILLAANAKSSTGTIFNGDSTLKNLANTIFDGINTKGDIK